MAENTTFSSSGAEVISRPVEVTTDDTADSLTVEEFEAYYDIDRTVSKIVEGDYKRIALQFPDELLHDSAPIFRALKRRIGDGRQLYILADTSYGSCCVDEVAASHVDADAMVHYGYACMSKNYRLPVIYVFGKKPIDPDDCAIRLIELFDSSSDGANPIELDLRLDVAYIHKLDSIKASLLKRLPGAIVHSTRPVFFFQPQAETSLASNDKLPTSEEESNPRMILYVGPESLGLTNLLMTHAGSTILSYDPLTKIARVESVKTNRLLMRRYAAVQRARDADIFGILIGTLGVASYLPLINHLRALLKRAHKKSYTVSVGKLNPAKLGNFLEIECFVLVACPENSMIDGKEFLRPIVTPYELEIALQAEQSWTGRYVLDFEKLLAEHASRTDDDEQKPEDVDLDQPSFSLITGKYRHARRYGDPKSVTSTANEPSSAVAIRNQDNSVSVLADSAAGEFLLQRSWQGLERRIGQDAPSLLEQGRSGIARGYDE